jgi:hypothetical protein
MHEMRVEGHGGVHWHCRLVGGGSREQYQQILLLTYVAADITGPCPLAGPSTVSRHESICYGTHYHSCCSINAINLAAKLECHWSNERDASQRTTELPSIVNTATHSNQQRENVRQNKLLLYNYVHNVCVIFTPNKAQFNPDSDKSCPNKAKRHGSPKTACITACMYPWALSFQCQRECLSIWTSYTSTLTCAAVISLSMISQWAGLRQQADKGKTARHGTKSHIEHECNMCSTQQSLAVPAGQLCFCTISSASFCLAHSG